MGSPIEKWEGAEAYFTFADNPTVMIAILIFSVVLTVVAIIKGSIHEEQSYQKVKNGK